MLNDLSAGYVRGLLDYNPDTGELTWRATKSGRRRKVAGTTGVWGNNGKRRSTITIDYVIYKTHRVIWLWMTGAWPTAQIDHINRDALDNRWANLRIATPLQNAHNRSLNRNNTSGANGVCWDKTAKRWRVDQYGKFVASFRTKEEAMRCAALPRKDFELK